GVDDVDTHTKREGVGYGVRKSRLNINRFQRGFIGKTTGQRTLSVIGRRTIRSENTQTNGGYITHVVDVVTERNDFIRHKVAATVVHTRFRRVAGHNTGRVGAHTVVKLAFQIQTGKTEAALRAIQAAHTGRIEKHHRRILGNRSTAGKGTAGAAGALLVDFKT